MRLVNFILKILSFLSGQMEFRKIPASDRVGDVVPLQIAVLTEVLSVNVPELQADIAVQDVKNVAGVTQHCLVETN